MKAEPMMPNACSIPCICRTLTKASSVVIFMARPRIVSNAFSEIGSGRDQWHDVSGLATNISIFRFFLFIFLSHEALVWRIETARFAGGSSRNAASRDARRIGGKHWCAEADDASLALLPRGGRLSPKDARRPQI